MAGVTPRLGPAPPWDKVERPPGHPEHRVPPVLQEHLELRAPLEHPDLQVHQDRREPPVRPAHRAHREVRGPQARPAVRAAQVRAVHPVAQVPAAPQEARVLTTIKLN